MSFSHTAMTDHPTLNSQQQQQHNDIQNAGKEQKAMHRHWLTARLSKQMKGHPKYEEEAKGVDHLHTHKSPPMNK